VESSSIILTLQQDRNIISQHRSRGKLTTNNHFTYADLIEYLSNVPKEKLNEFYALDRNYPILESNGLDDVLNDGHVYLKI
jgi:hypothetical protein